jgi:hypothetical protein
MFKLPLRSVAPTVALAALVLATAQAQPPPPFQLLPTRSVARNWSEALIFALRRDSGRVAYNSRVVFQFSVALYDAWAVHDADARPYLLGETVNGFTCPYRPTGGVDSSAAAQEITINYAAYRYMRHRFSKSVNATESYAVFDEVMKHYGLDPSYTSIDYERDPSPAALGNYIADCVIRYGLDDGSNEANDYRTRFYEPVNPALDPTDPDSIADLVDPDRWQKLALATFVNKTGQTIPVPDFESPEWGFTSPFAMVASDRRVFERDGAEYWVYHDPGKPALISATDPDAMPAEYIWGFSLVAIWSGHLDPSRGHGARLIDISPASLGDNQGFPQTIPEYRDFYDFLGGGDHSPGHAQNPVTGRPYEPQLVPLADYARTSVNFWADGPYTAETPPGSLMLILNEQVSDSPGFEKRIGGVGPVVDDLE